MVRWLTALAVVLFGMSMGQAAAQDTAEVPFSCRNDVTSLCAAAGRGAEPVLACLNARLDEVSDTCRIVLAADERGDRPDFGACNGEVELYCSDVEPGDGRISACLVENKALLNARCRVYQIRIRD